MHRVLVVLLLGIVTLASAGAAGNAQGVVGRIVGEIAREGIEDAVEDAALDAVLFGVAGGIVREVRESDADEFIGAVAGEGFETAMFRDCRQAGAARRGIATLTSSYQHSCRMSDSTRCRISSRMART
jgi:hypothetical protein